MKGKKKEKPRDRAARVRERAVVVKSCGGRKERKAIQLQNVDGGWRLTLSLLVLCSVVVIWPSKLQFPQVVSCPIRKAAEAPLTSRGVLGEALQGVVAGKRRHVMK